MTSWIISLALVLALNDVTRAETLLDTVLYVVSLNRAHDNETQTVTVRQTDDMIEANFASKTVPLNIPISIARLDHCRFRVDRRLPNFPETYTVDFATSEFRDGCRTRWAGISRPSRSRRRAIVPLTGIRTLMSV